MTWDSSSTWSGQKLQNLSLTGIFKRRPISKCIGATPHLKRDIADRGFTAFTFNTYSSTLYSVLNSLFVLNLFNPMPLFAFILSTSFLQLNSHFNWQQFNCRSKYRVSILAGWDIYHPSCTWNEMNGDLGHLCAHSGLNWARRTSWE